MRGMSPRSVLETLTDRYRLIAEETLMRLGPIIVLGEMIQAQLADGGPTWHGEYAEFGWCITGEQRSYSTRYGTIGGISPNRPVELGGLGAWEVAVRWSKTDLSDGGGDRGQVRSVALNWYPTDPVRIKLRAVLATDGTLARPPILIEAPPSAKGVAVVKSAMSALQACQPYKMLPADKYGEWKVMDLPFSPRDFGGG